MKTYHFALLITMLFANQFVNAQEACSKFYPMAEGSSFQYTISNKKGKVEGVTDYVIKDVNTSGGSTNATFDIKFTDEKGKEVFKTDYQISCSDNGIKIDYNSLVPSQMMAQYEDMGVEMDITGTDIEIPNDLNVGDVLKDANVSVALNMGAMKMNITVDQTNRKILGKETVTTAAGTFDCYVISEDTTSKVMGVTTDMGNKIWLAEGVGMVRQESYTKKGDLMSRSELTKFTK